MEKSTRWLREVKHLCADIGSEDGVDPRYLARTNKVNKKKHNAQLAKLAGRTISALLSGEISDPVLNQLEVAEVAVSEDGQFLTVFIRHSTESGSWAVILEKLRGIQGFMRAQLARAVNRKKVPALVFNPVPGE